MYEHYTFSQYVSKIGTTGYAAVPAVR